MSVIKTTKSTRRYSFRREVSYTSLHVFYSAVDSSSTQVPRIADAVEYALARVHNVIGVVDWVKLAGMPASAFGVPSFLACGARFQTTMSLEPSVDSALADFVDTIASEFTALKKRKPYRPFAVALLLRAVIAEEKGVLPYKVAGGDKLPADAPAAFDPSELLSADASRAADPARKKHMTFARIDPSIFDQSDLFPNGKVDAEGYADDSELF